MTALARQLSARELGGGRWRVDLVLVPDPDDPVARPRPHPGSVALRAASGGERVRAQIESLAIPAPSARDRFSVVLAVDDASRPGTSSRFVLSGDGWSAQVDLTAAEEPAPPMPHPAPPVPAAVDYTARDFDALRTMLLGVIDERFGEGLADHPVSQTAALVEQIAYLGDALSYGQDAVATEAYLASARRRISVARHAALLDYPVFEGRCARTWVRFEVSEPLELPARTMVLARAPSFGPVLAERELADAIAAGALVFETLEPVELTPRDQPCELSREHHPDGRLTARATAATLVGPCPELHAGGLVTLEPAGPDRSAAGQVVRITTVQRAGATTTVAWDQADALADDWALTYPALCLRPGNLVLADQGQTHGWTSLPAPVAGRRYWPELPTARPAFSAAAPARGAAASAAEMLAPRAGTVLAAVELREGEHPHVRGWMQRESLLESGPLDPGFVVEVDDEGAARLRFGDGTNGMAPQPGTRFSVRMRSGGGAAGNVGPGAIAHVVTSDQRLRGVRNPARAVGGAEPETAASVRLNAPSAFRITDRAVTPIEYTAAAFEVPGVVDATTIIVPSGSGPLARVRIHTGDWNVPAAPLAGRVREQLDRRRPVGVALDVQGAIAMAATIELEIGVWSGWTLAAMSQAIDRALRATLLAPRCFGFGTTLHRSDLVRILGALPGVADVTLARFDWTRPGTTRAKDALLPPFGHVIRIGNDLTAPEQGSVSFRLRSAA